MTNILLLTVHHEIFPRYRYVHTEKNRGDALLSLSQELRILILVFRDSDHEAGAIVALGQSSHQHFLRAAIAV